MIIQTVTHQTEDLPCVGCGLNDEPTGFCIVLPGGVACVCTTCYDADTVWQWLEVPNERWGRA